MKLPTLAHLLHIGADAIESSAPVWDPYGRKPWRLASLSDRGEFIRGPKREKTVGYPEGLPGLPYEFATAAEAVDWANAALKRLSRSRRKIPVK